MGCELHIAPELTPQHSLQIIEIALTLFALLVAFGAPALGSAAFEAVERGARKLAARRSLAILLIALAAPAIRLAILSWRPIPQPAIHDEFSYLLAADTFASGRLANSTHPLWTHFETFHVNQFPTYMSMYFPGQGMALAFGQKFLGGPWFAVCASVGLMCAAVCWMLYGWLPPGWALLGGALVVLRVGVASYWMDSYWGGALPAMGGAMVLGALPRLMRRPRGRTALLLGLGCAILVNTRPYEGLLLSLPVAAALLVWMFRRRAHWRLIGTRVVIPLSMVLLLTAAAMAYYNSRVFGNPLTPPYRINRATYAVAPVFIWQSTGPQPVYRHEVMRRFYLQWELTVFNKARTAAGFLQNVSVKIGLAVAFFLGPLLAVPLVMLPRVLRDRRWLFLTAAAAVFAAGQALNAFSVPHYFAPATALVYAIVLLSMRHLRGWRYRNQPAGLFLVRVLPLLCAVTLAFQIARSAGIPPKESPRAAIERRLEALPGPQLAIVRYTPGHDYMGEWVYNRADIDGAKLVWAREMDRDHNRQLLDYFKDRQAWLIEPDQKPPRISPYTP